MNRREVVTVANLGSEGGRWGMVWMGGEGEGEGEREGEGEGGSKSSLIYGE